MGPKAAVHLTLSSNEAIKSQQVRCLWAGTAQQCVPGGHRSFSFRFNGCSTLQLLRTGFEVVHLSDLCRYVFFSLSQRALRLGIPPFDGPIAYIHLLSDHKQGNCHTGQLVQMAITWFRLAIIASIYLPTQCAAQIYGYHVETPFLFDVGEE